MKLIIIKKSFVVLTVLLISFVGASVAVPAFVPKPIYKHIVVIDAGHGGRDGGASGIASGVLEKDLNLAYAFTLKKMLEGNGIGVVLTRTSDAGLYNEWDNNKKANDMQKREAILLDSGASLFVSIHMNSFELTSVKGSQVFFYPSSSVSEQLALLTQMVLKKMVPFAKPAPKTVDFYLLKVAPMPAILIECGYLTNPEEEALLQTAEHKNKLCYALFCGIFAFLHQNN